MSHWTKIKFAGRLGDIEARKKRCAETELSNIGLPRLDVFQRLRGAILQHLLGEDDAALAWLADWYAGTSIGEAAQEALSLKAAVPDSSQATRRIRRQ